LAQKPPVAQPAKPAAPAPAAQVPALSGRVLDAVSMQPIADAVVQAGENIFRVLQTLPGVNATADFDSRLSVRGGGPDQNLTLMDGVEIHDPYRLFGLASAFNPETVQNFELTAGGFSPKHGDRLSSILVIENRSGIARGCLTGGTLSLLIASLGTPYEIDTCDRIVFLEDVGEEPHRIDRMLTHMIGAGKLSDAVGVALGTFTDTRIRNSPGRRSLRLGEVFADHLLPLKIPVLANLAVGHVPDQVTLPYGVRAHLNTSARTLELLEPGVV
jgi:hypothetical protein